MTLPHSHMDMVSIKEIAEELKVGKDYALRLIKRRAESLGLKPHYGKRNAVSLSRADADRLIEDYRPMRPFLSDAKSAPRGYFYIIQLHPEDLPNRLKIGYTDDINRRLSDFGPSAPTLRLVKCWPCKGYPGRLRRQGLRYQRALHCRRRRSLRWRSSRVCREG